MLTISQPPALLPKLTSAEVSALRDSDWETRERAYHDTAIEEINSLVRKYNGMAPYSVRKPYYMRVAELENDLLALELTALRVVANSADGKPHPASSVLKLRGTELQQAATELLVDVAGPLALASGADEGSDVPEWARVATPGYLNFRKASIYGGSNEVQHQIIAGSILGL